MVSFRNRATPFLEHNIAFVHFEQNQIQFNQIVSQQFYNNQTAKIFACGKLFYVVRYFWEKDPNFNQSEGRKYSFPTSDWPEFGILPQKYRTILPSG